VASNWKVTWQKAGHMTLVLPEIGCKALECVFMVRQIHTTCRRTHHKKRRVRVKNTTKLTLKKVPKKERKKERVLLMYLST
jgi:hypothetical protein